ncbi:MAG TPA: lysophospholipid acyltransferase family protein [Mycobacteriales bacterium]|nr:lysophospholipid acyltransferase family protein [Mycobacteriales bacterium]
MKSTVAQLARDFRWGHRPAVPRDAVPHIKAAKATEFPTAWARTPAARAFRTVAQDVGLAALIKAEVKLVVTGRDRLAALGEQPCVIVCNHSSHLDTAALICALPPEWRRRTAVAAAADYFFDAWWRAVGTALVFGTVPIERRGGVPSQKPGELLDDGWNVVVFPEGTRSPDGWMHEWKTGAARLAIDHGVPVLPVAIRGTFAAMPRGRSWPKPGRPPVHIRFGRPLAPGRDEDPKALLGRMREELARVVDEDTSGWYASLRKQAEGRTPDPAGPEASRWRRTWDASAPPVKLDRGRVWK